MDTETITEKKVHHGHNVKRLREMLGVKQEALANELGLSQQTVSRLESQEELDEDMLNKIAKVLQVRPETIKNFDEDAAINIIHNTFNSNDNSTMNANTNTTAINPNYTFNPIDKIIELYEEKAQLYERMLKTIQDKNSLLEKLLSEKK